MNCSKMINITECRTFRKIESNRGASLIIALIYFLVASMVGAVVLTAALANASHVKREHQQEQDYLILKSAVVMTQNKLNQQGSDAEAVYYINPEKQADFDDDSKYTGFSSQLNEPKYASESEKASFKTASDIKTLLNSTDTDLIKQTIRSACFDCFGKAIKTDNGKFIANLDEAAIDPVVLHIESSSIGDGKLPSVVAKITMKPDYVVRESVDDITDSQQLAIKMQIDFALKYPGKEYAEPAAISLMANVIYSYELETRVLEQTETVSNNEDPNNVHDEEITRYFVKYKSDTDLSYHDVVIQKAASTT